MQVGCTVEWRKGVQVSVEMSGGSMLVSESTPAAASTCLIEIVCSSLEL